MAHVIRCTGCTADYQPHEVPPTCTRCGSSAGWCQINLPDEFTAAADAIMGNVGREVTKEDQEAAAREKMLGVEKAPGVCSQEGCDEQATHRFTWPGNPERVVCPLHASAAVRISQAMGFFLEVPALETIDATFADDDDEPAPSTPRDVDD
jgi:hypothetical protein